MIRLHGLNKASTLGSNSASLKVRPSPKQAEQIEQLIDTVSLLSEELKGLKALMEKNNIQAVVPKARRTRKVKEEIVNDVVKVNPLPVESNGV
jgi:FtsZ-binding cell division protein ZapB